MNVDLRIAGGTVVDPERGISAGGDVLVRDQSIVDPIPGDRVEAARTIDASGCLVLPGLIDFHAHLFGGGTESGVPADASLLPMGVTTAVDAGSCGSANYESFLRTIVPGSRVRIFSFVNVAPAGLIVARLPEDLDPAHYDEPRITELVERNRGQCLGLKIRLSKEIVGDLGAAPLVRAVELADQLECSVTVHTTNPPIAPAEIAAILRPDDVYCHVYQGRGQTIVGPDCKVAAGIVAARRRGVRFDTANGRQNFAFKVAKAALADGFLPDIISSDLTSRTLFGDFVFSLPLVMMKYLAMGMTLEQVVAASTSIPARQIGMQGKLGTLAPGAWADIAIFRRAARPPLVVRDETGDSVALADWLLPQMTILGGRIVYRQIDFQ